jgi:hypothetical protein
MDMSSVLARSMVFLAVRLSVPDGVPVAHDGLVVDV